MSDGLKLVGYSSDSIEDFFYIRHAKKRRKRKTGYCVYCNIELNEKNGSRDHVYPKSLGGRETLPCCTTCNGEKRDMTLVQYMQYCGKRLYKFEVNAPQYPLYKTKIANIEKLLATKNF